MATNTPNINLIKPEGTEKYDLFVVNKNSDTIDTEITDAKAGSGSRIFKCKTDLSAQDNAMNLQGCDGRYVNKTGDTMSGNLVQDVSSGIFMYKGKDASGHFYINGESDRVRWVNKVGAGEEEVFSSSYAENRINFVATPKAGSQPTSADHLTRKDYVENNYVAKTGDTMTGMLRSEGLGNSRMYTSVSTYTALTGGVKITMNGAPDKSQMIRLRIIMNGYATTNMPVQIDLQCYFYATSHTIIHYGVTSTHSGLTDVYIYEDAVTGKPSIWLGGSLFGVSQTISVEMLNAIENSFVEKIENAPKPINGVRGVQSPIKITGAGEVPINGIIMYHGAIANIPANFRLCDGSNGTPNLVDRFVMGTAGTTGTTGGSNNAEVISHNHTASHNHSATFTGTASSHSHLNSIRSIAGNARGGGDTPLFSAVSNAVALTTPATSITPSGSVSVATASVTTSTTGVAGAGKNMPAYVALAYIMRVS